MIRAKPIDPALEAELARGVDLHRAGRLAEAETAYRAVLARAPEHAHALNYLGTLLAASGRPKEGLDLLRRSVKRAAAVPELHLNLADALANAGQLEAAEGPLRKALQLRRTPEALAKLGTVLLRQGKARLATHQLEQALKLDPALVQARQNLGILRAQLGNMTEAAALLRGAVALAPSFVDALNALAMVEHRTNRLNDAAARLRRVQAVMPLFASALTNLATVLDAQGRTRESARLLRQALTLTPGDPSVWGNLANLAQDRGRPAEAEELLGRALSLRVGDASLWSNLGRSLNVQGRSAEAAGCYRRALELDPGHVGARSNLLFAMTYASETTNEELFGAVTRTLQGMRVKIRERPGRRPRSGRLRVGVVSADLRDHPVGRNVLGIFEHHREVELHAYADSLADDETTGGFRRHADGWRISAGLSDAALAEQMRRDGIDVVLLLAANTAGNRPLLAAERGAPVQVSFHDLLSSGIPAMDWWITDAVLHPETTTERFVERLWRLPTFYLHRPPAEAPDPGPPPSAGRGVVTFGSFNHPAKLTPTVASLWARVLHAAPGSSLLLKYLDIYADGAVRGRYEALFAAHGIGAERLDFRTGRLARREQMELLRQVDIALDPFPFNGSTTSFEALWMGVPLVTLAGERFLGRVGASVLSAIGQNFLVAADETSYVDIAAALAADASRLASLHRDLRAQVLASPICDAPSYTRTFEAALLAMAS
jgi:predicted O-linked N-acetylglucosamine transferase (SPINDLY family)